jgi:hypothetical protein
LRLQQRLQQLLPPTLLPHPLPKDLHAKDLLAQDSLLPTTLWFALWFELCS